METENKPAKKADELIDRGENSDLMESFISNKSFGHRTDLADLVRLNLLLALR